MEWLTSQAMCQAYLPKNKRSLKDTLLQARAQVALLRLTSWGTASVQRTTMESLCFRAFNAVHLATCIEAKHKGTLATHVWERPLLSPSCSWNNSWTSDHRPLSNTKWSRHLGPFSANLPADQTAPLSQTSQAGRCTTTTNERQPSQQQWNGKY